MTHRRAKLIETVRGDLRDRGFEIGTQQDHGSQREFVAVAGGDRGRSGASLPDPLVVTTLRSGTPLEVASAVARAAAEDRVPAIVAGPETAARIRDVLADPPLLAGRDGGRTFYGVADRILLQEGGYACIAADPTATVRWSERAGEPTDEPALVLTVDDTPRVTLESVEQLTCPGPTAAAVTLRYVRERGQFRVLDGDEPLGQYDSTVAMRAAGYRPVELPLVPEHHVRTNGRRARDVVLGTVTADGAVEYEQPIRAN